MMVKSFFFGKINQIKSGKSGQTALDMDEQPLLQGASNNGLTSRVEECPVTPTAELVPNQLHMSGIGGGEPYTLMPC